MDTILSRWANLDMRRRIIVIGATLAIFAAVLGLAQGTATRDQALLYAGLDPSAAGDVLAALDQRGVIYDIRGDAIYVPATDRDLLRLALAGEGLPDTGAQGYELLDSLTGFGTTAQMFDAAYWRAKEGELARTILSVPGIRTARVHLSTPANRPFARDQRATAAITVGMNGGTLPADRARALRYLVASAVPGLAPADVAVIDAAGGLIAMDDAAGSGDSRADLLRDRAMRLLEARVGYGNAAVEIAIETVTDTESILERRIDPESRIAVSTDVEESESSATAAGSGAVTVASNLPDGDAAGQNDGSQSADSDTRTVTNFDLSETSREVLRAPGAVRRMSVAVLVNDIVTTAADGSVTTAPRPEDELTALRDLVASAVGLDEARGDIITLRAMSFLPIPDTGSEAVAAGLPLDLMALARLGILALVALVLGLFVLRPLLASGRPPRLTDQRSLPPPDLASDLPPLPTFQNNALSPDMLDVGPADPVARLRQLIESRQDETIQILQDWIEEPPRRERT